MNDKLQNLIRLNFHKYIGSIKHLLDLHNTKNSLNLNKTKIIDKDKDRKCLYIRETLLLNKLKFAFNTQYNNFNNILKLHINT